MEMRPVHGGCIIPVSTVGVGIEEDVVQEGETVAVVDLLKVGLGSALCADTDGVAGCEGWSYD